MPLGAYLHLYIHNTSANAVSITDAKLEGVSLANAVAFSDQKRADLWPASIHFSKLPKADLDRLVAAGEPVWWKVDPLSLPPGGFAEVTVRLRRQVKTAATLEVLGGEATWKARVPIADTPRFRGISFSPALDTVYCYVQHPQRPDAAPVKVLLDGQDVTARTTMAADRAVSVMPLVIRPAQPLAKGPSIASRPSTMTARRRSQASARGVTNSFMACGVTSTTARPRRKRWIIFWATCSGTT